jgi:hypothetical protein
MPNVSLARRTEMTTVATIKKNLFQHYFPEQFESEKLQWETKKRKKREVAHAIVEIRKAIKVNLSSLSKG